jgi:hypothetical protein
MPPSDQCHLRRAAGGVRGGGVGARGRCRHPGGWRGDQRSLIGSESRHDGGHSSGQPLHTLASAASLSEAITVGLCSTQFMWWNDHTIPNVCLGDRQYTGRQIRMGTRGHPNISCFCNSIDRPAAPPPPLTHFCLARGVRRAMIGRRGDPFNNGVDHCSSRPALEAFLGSHQAAHSAFLPCSGANNNPRNQRSVALRSVVQPWIQRQPLSLAVNAYAFE